MCFLPLFCPLVVCLYFVIFFLGYWSLPFSFFSLKVSLSSYFAWSLFLLPCPWCELLSSISLCFSDFSWVCGSVLHKGSHGLTLLEKHLLWLGFTPVTVSPDCLSKGLSRGKRSYPKMSMTSKRLQFLYGSLCILPQTVFHTTAEWAVAALPLRVCFRSIKSKLHCRC